MKAVILVGGKSSRMGRDKALLEVGGVRQIDRMTSLVRPFAGEIFLSVAHEDSGEHNWPVLRDLEPSPGPLGGLAAAFAHDAQAEWFILACDLAFISGDDLKSLVDGHDGSKDATCFLNPLDGQPEPLCALYSPSAAPKLAEALEKNQRCARRFLSSLTRTEHTPSGPRALLNLNRPEHLVELELLQANGAVEKSIKVEYFAKLAHEAGCEMEEIQTSAATLVGLWEEVRLKHHFSLDLPTVKPAVDNEFASWTDPMESGQTIAFMPPFAGG